MTRNRRPITRGLVAALTLALISALVSHGPVSGVTPAQEGVDALPVADSTPVIIVHGISSDVCDYADEGELNATASGLTGAGRGIDREIRDAIYDRYEFYVGDSTAVASCVEQSNSGMLYHTYPDDRGRGSGEEFISAVVAEENADHLAALVLAAAEASPTGQVDLIGYSLGGLTMRTMMARYGDLRPAVGRMVFLNTVHEGAWTAAIARLFTDLVESNASPRSVLDAINGCAGYLETNQIVDTADAALLCQVATATVAALVIAPGDFLSDPIADLVLQPAIESLYPGSPVIVDNASSSLEGIDVMVIGSDQRIRQKPGVGIPLTGIRINTPVGKEHEWSGDHVIQAGIGSGAEMREQGSMLMNPATALTARTYQEWIFYEECSYEIGAIDGIKAFGRELGADVLKAVGRLVPGVSDEVVEDVVNQMAGVLRGIDLVTEFARWKGLSFIDNFAGLYQYADCILGSDFFHGDIPAADDVSRSAVVGREVVNLGNGRLEGSITRSVRGLDPDEYESLDDIAARLGPETWSSADLIVTFLAGNDETRLPGIEDPGATFLRSGLADALGTQQRFAADFLGIEEESVTEPPAVLVLLDTSGSMSDRDGNGVRKIEGARLAVEAYVNGIGVDTATGMRTFAGSSCDGGDLVVPIGTGNSSTVTATLAGMRTGGGTPTAAALEQAAVDLAGRRAPSVVLVSDGKSNECGDPCPVAERLAAEGIGLTVNTVGFQIDADGQAELECIANATNGTYSDVQDSEELIQEFLELQRAELLLEITASSELVANENGYTPFEVRARLVNNGPGIAENVTITLDGDSGLIGAPRVNSFGELGAGVDIAIVLAEGVPRRYEPSMLDWSLEADASNASAVRFEGEVSIPSTWVGVNDAGSILRTARSPIQLGDSYSAGEGAGDYDPGTNGPGNTCHRSPSTYGAQLYPGINNAACSGAVIGDLYHPNGNEPPQLDRIPPDTDLVLMSMGGNDLGFFTIILRCLLSSYCADDDSGLAEWACEKTESCIPSPLTGEELVQLRLAPLRSSLYWAYRAILDRAPGATLVVVPYPRVVPPSAQPGDTCPSQISPPEVEWLDSVITRLNDAVEDAAEAAEADGFNVRFARDVRNAFAGHSICDPEPYVRDFEELTFLDEQVSNWINQRVSGAELQNDVQQAFHPTARGYIDIAEKIKSSSRDWDPATYVTRATRTDDTVAGIGSGGTAYELQGGVSGELVIGETYRFTANDLAPGSRASVVLASDPILVGAGRVDASGRLEIAARIPDIEAGAHELRLSAVAADGAESVWREPVTVATANADSLVGGRALAGILLVILALALGVWAWRQRRETQVS